MTPEFYRHILESRLKAIRKFRTELDEVENRIIALQDFVDEARFIIAVNNQRKEDHFGSNHRHQSHPGQHHAQGS